MEQADLFDSLSFRYQQPKTPKNDFLSRYSIVLRFDQILILSIVFLVAFALVFSFGVERGKKGSVAEVVALQAKYQKAMEELGSKAFEPLGAPKEEKPQSVISESLEMVSQAPSTEVISIRTSEPEESVTPKEAAQEVAEPKGVIKGKYTIQMVTYKTEKAAHRLIDKLTEIGHKTFLIPSGKYIQVCLEAFESKQSASKAMKRFKVEGLIPADAYVRTFPS